MRGIANKIYFAFFFTVEMSGTQQINGDGQYRLICRIESKKQEVTTYKKHFDFSQAAKLKFPK